MNTVPDLSYEKICPVGNHPFTAKRTNQIYCDLKHQKFKNNWEAKKKRDLTKKINAILLKNREILEMLYSIGQSITKDQLLSLGFQHDYLTQIGKEEGKLAYGIYEFTLVPIEKGYKIIKEAQWKN